MPKKVYDPNAEYVCLHGRLSIKGDKNNRRYISYSDVDSSGKKVTFKLSHLQPHEVAYLAENLRQVQPAADYFAQETKSNKGGTK